MNYNNDETLRDLVVKKLIDFLKEYKNSQLNL